jgi:hypothetical protein
MTTTTPTVRCNRCRRVLVSDWAAVGLGPVCAARLGLQRRRVRVRAPVRTGGAEPVLDGWDELMEDEGSEGTWAE